MNKTKARIRYQKVGLKRFIGHQDILRYWDRLLRRAKLPVRYSEGFNPRPKISCPSPLPLGVEGLEEIIEIELVESVSNEELKSRMESVQASGFEILHVETIAKKKSAPVSSMHYRLKIPENLIPANLDSNIEKVLSQTNIEVLRTRRKEVSKCIDIRPYIKTLEQSPHGIHFELHVENGKTAKPLEILEILGIQDLIHQGAILQRTKLTFVEE